MEYLFQENISFVDVYVEVKMMMEEDRCRSLRRNFLLNYKHRNRKTTELNSIEDLLFFYLIRLNCLSFTGVFLRIVLFCNDDRSFNLI